MRSVFHRFKAMTITAIGSCLAITSLAGTPQKWEDLPKAVQKTVLANGGTSGMTVDLENKKIDNKAVYEAGVKGKDGLIHDLVITEDGKLVETKTDDAADIVAERAARAEKVLTGVTFSRPREITNPYLPLASLKQDILEGMEGGKKFRVERTAKPDLHKTFKIGDKTIDTLVFEDRAYEDGQLVEVAMDYFAQDDNGAVYYFGEDVDEYENGKIIGHDGAWLFGKDTPAPGILFPAQPKLNDKWRSEDVSSDISEIDELVSISEKVVTPAATYENCAKVKEYLADGTIEYKYYAKGVGVVREQPEDGDTFLISHNASQAAAEKTISRKIKNAVSKNIAAAKKNETLLNAMSPYEDMAEAALDKDTKGVKEAISAAGSETADVVKALPKENVKGFEERLSAIKDAAKAKDHYSVAVNAVEMFRYLTDSLDATKLEVPKEVSLLDYAGFRLQVLAAATEPDWEKMKLTVVEADQWWKAIEEKVEDSSLAATFKSTMAGLQQAIESENLSMLRFAAQIDLDLVDLLESAFE